MVQGHLTTLPSNSSVKVNLTAYGIIEIQLVKGSTKTKWIIFYDLPDNALGSLKRDGSNAKLGIVTINSIINDFYKSYIVMMGSWSQTYVMVSKHGLLSLRIVLSLRAHHLQNCFPTSHDTCFEWILRALEVSWAWLLDSVLSNTNSSMPDQWMGSIDL